MKGKRIENKNDCIDLKTLVENLVNNGVESIYLLPTLSREFGGDIIALRAHMAPEEGQQVTRPYADVNIGNERYELDVEFALDGMRPNPEVPVFVTSGWTGVEPVSVEEGVEQVFEFVSGGAE